MPSRTGDKAPEGDTPKSEQKERRRHHNHRHRSSRSKRTPMKEASDAGDADVPELGPRGLPESPFQSRTSLPYPSFSKMHSREAVNSGENITFAPRKNVYTPDPTDVPNRSDSQTGSRPITPRKVNAPPSPPLTAEDHATNLEAKRKSLECIGEDIRKKFRDVELVSRNEVEPDSAQILDGSRDMRSPESKASQAGSNCPKVRKANSMNPVYAASGSCPNDGVSTILSTHRRRRSVSPTSSTKTSIAPEQPKLQHPSYFATSGKTSPTSAQSTLPRTPTDREDPSIPGRTSSRDSELSPFNRVTSNAGIHMPPPPPPPVIPRANPRVDYLMQHGGLLHAVPKQYVRANSAQMPLQFTIGEPPDRNLLKREANQFFAPFNQLLEDYTKVMSKNGSIAVATGYRSVARRLLDRLEAVFARDITAEACSCLVCESATSKGDSDPEEVSWGEILEYVSGRQLLPQWPPLILQPSTRGLDFPTNSGQLPMQKLDIDVPEEYRDHYIRQSRKTKLTVDRWLAGQSDAISAPEEADDDTLTFAILTHLNSTERSQLTQLLGVPSSRPPSIALGSERSQPLDKIGTDLLARTGLALQRLYRLPNRPRLPECGLYLLKSPSLHNVLATLAAISDAEWDILISGRFDGFLRSGAEDAANSDSANRIMSRGQMSVTPDYSISNGQPPTPAGIGSTGAPVTIDEETEITALAEIEQEIFVGMEALEDAFEALHVRAEGVRAALRERGAGLAIQAQTRKGSNAVVPETRLGTPAMAKSWDSETDDGMDDAVSELAPDDSASNISRSRMRRPKRRSERRTPAPVEEIYEEENNPQPSRPAVAFREFKGRGSRSMNH